MRESQSAVDFLESRGYTVRAMNDCNCSDGVVSYWVMTPSMVNFHCSEDQLLNLKLQVEGKNEA